MYLSENLEIRIKYFFLIVEGWVGATLVGIHKIPLSATEISVQHI